MDVLSKADPEVWQAVAGERQRQQTGLEVIASENYASAAGMAGYGVSKDTETIDFDQVAALAKEHKPKLVIAGASAYPRHIDFARFAEICKATGALLLVDMAHVAGLVAAEQHENPVLFADFVS